MFQWKPPYLISWNLVFHESGTAEPLFFCETHGSPEPTLKRLFKNSWRLFWKGFLQKHESHQCYFLYYQRHMQIRWISVKHHIPWRRHTTSNRGISKHNSALYGKPRIYQTNCWSIWKNWIHSTEKIVEKMVSYIFENQKNLSRRQLKRRYLQLPKFRNKNVDSQECRNNWWLPY